MYTEASVCELGTEQVVMGEGQQLWDTGQHVSQVGLAWAKGCIEGCVLHAGRRTQTCFGKVDHRHHRVAMLGVGVIGMVQAKHAVKQAMLTLAWGLNNSLRRQ
jgi:hypothetical protein